MKQNSREMLCDIDLLRTIRLIMHLNAIMQLKWYSICTPHMRAHYALRSCSQYFIFTVSVVWGLHCTPYRMGLFNYIETRIAVTSSTIQLSQHALFETISIHRRKMLASSLLTSEWEWNTDANWHEHWWEWFKIPVGLFKSYQLMSADW